MTRKDFVLIADTIRTMELTDTTRERETIAKAFANVLHTTNPNFKRDIFLQACGVAS